MNLFVEPAEWRQHAACNGEPTDLWYSDKPEDERAAKAICATCPVIDDCLAHALNSPDEHGVWGGLSDRQRKTRRRGANVYRTRLCPTCRKAFQQPVRPGGGRLYCTGCRPLQLVKDRTA